MLKKLLGRRTLGLTYSQEIIGKGPACPHGLGGHRVKADRRAVQVRQGQDLAQDQESKRAGNTAVSRRSLIGLTQSHLAVRDQT